MPAGEGTRRGRRSSKEDLASYQGVEGIPSLRRLHSLALWLRNSSIHANIWDDRIGLRLGIDNVTRWSSWYRVIDNLFRKKPQIVQFMVDYEEELGENRLTGSDWDLLSKAHLFLQPFALATLYAEGDKSSLSQSLFLMDCLLHHYEKQKVCLSIIPQPMLISDQTYYSTADSYDVRMLHAIEMGWFIINKYYTMVEDVPVYSAALLLHPSRRDAYIKKNWPDEWYEGAVGGAREIWEEEYNVDLPNNHHAVPEPVVAPIKHKDNQLALLMKDIEVKAAISRDEDSFMSFITSQPIAIDYTPLQWWCRLEQRQQYPRLSRMAIAILSIPSESSEPERTFSGARRTCSWDRLRITCARIEMVECIGSWLREGHIVPLSRGGLGLPMMPSPDDDAVNQDDDLANIDEAI